MVPVKLHQLIFLILVGAYINQAQESDAPWDYDNTTEWGTSYPECNGQNQSPIALMSSSSFIKNIPPLKFGYYQSQLSSPITLVNTGYTVNINIPTTTSGKRPYIVNSLTNNKFEAMSLHFHWGSEGVKGSEHEINGQRFDVEIHIVHQNAKYPDESEALQNKDGLAVLGIMLQGVKRSPSSYPGLKQIFDRLPDLLESNSTQVKGSLTLGQILGDLRTSSFFTYNGSLTTPPCSEAVNWFVFPQPLKVPIKQIQKFWDLLDFNGDPLINNFRPLQDRNGRPVYYRIGALWNNPIFLP